MAIKCPPRTTCRGQAKAMVVKGSNPTRGRNREHDYSSPSGADSLEAYLEQIDREVQKLRPKKERLQGCVEEALARSEDLKGWRIEVVGSTSWAGEVPQSDLDLVLLSPEADDASQPQTEGREAVAILEKLKGALQEGSKSRLEGLDELKTAAEEQGQIWRRLELIDAARVPILRIHEGSAQGLCCDVSVNQRHALRHRKFLVEMLEDRPRVRSLIQLIKFWLRRRGLPTAAEGGLPSLAWSVLALRLSEDLPADEPVERLIWKFFHRMHRLREESVCVRHPRQRRNNFQGSRHSPWAWAQEWIQFLWVDDPCSAEKAGAKTASFALGLTPPSIPVALAVLYTAELQLAWQAVREGKWDELWRPVQPEVRMNLPAVVSDKKVTSLHILLREGVVHVGQLVEVRRCPGVRQEALHRRDQSSELTLQPCVLEQASSSSGPMSVSVRKDAPSVVCQPCHWVCALPTWGTPTSGTCKVLQGDGLARLEAIQKLVEDAQHAAWGEAIGSRRQQSFSTHQHQQLMEGMQPMRNIGVLAPQRGHQMTSCMPQAWALTGMVWQPDMMLDVSLDHWMPQSGTAGSSRSRMTAVPLGNHRSARSVPKQVPQREVVAGNKSRQVRKVQDKPRSADDGSCYPDQCPQKVHSDDSTRASDSGDEPRGEGGLRQAVGDHTSSSPSICSTATNNPPAAAAEEAARADGCEAAGSKHAAEEDRESAKETSRGLDRVAEGTQGSPGGSSAPLELTVVLATECRTAFPPLKANAAEQSQPLQDAAISKWASFKPKSVLASETKSAMASAGKIQSSHNSQRLPSQLGTQSSGPKTMPSHGGNRAAQLPAAGASKPDPCEEQQAQTDTHAEVSTRATSEKQQPIEQRQSCSAEVKAPCEEEAEESVEAVADGEELEGEGDDSGDEEASAEGEESEEEDASEEEEEAKQEAEDFDEDDTEEREGEVGEGESGEDDETEDDFITLSNEEATDEENQEGEDLLWLDEEEEEEEEEGGEKGQINELDDEAQVEAPDDAEEEDSTSEECNVDGEEEEMHPQSKDEGKAPKQHEVVASTGAGSPAIKARDWNGGPTQATDVKHFVVHDVSEVVSKFRHGQAPDQWEAPRKLHNWSTILALSLDPGKCLSNAQRSVLGKSHL
mmetsp:Transcript_49172/g.114998  ORF Transcript_49172/g.114998 Transcript_49172/m.114998 type:complete len:1135 (+) Transcript_49172:76-3480(+)